MSSLINNSRPTIIGIGGLTSEVGKTTLLCKFLSAFPGWEAIKTTRGHYRSCGKDPHMCCVSDLLSGEPVVHSGRELTYAAGKDTGRYWEAGATNVHWVIATDDQVEAGINEALSRVKAEGVFIEGNSFTEYVEPDYFVMVARPGEVKMKATARRALKHVSALYLSADARPHASTANAFADLPANLPIYYPGVLTQLVDHLKSTHLSVRVQIEDTHRALCAS
jgi:hypothetical protein